MVHAVPTRVVIAGATGFLGRPLVRRLQRDTAYQIAGLTRAAAHTGPDGIELVQADLFSLKDAENALAGARYAIYLVHSMSRTARLVQGSFADLDLICADNFGRAARIAGVEQIVYVGGLQPDGAEATSPHLRSRKEVGVALGFHGTPVTELRAGLILGPSGSSWELMARLVRRLPVLVCPAWTSHRTQPIDLDTMVELLARVLGDQQTFGRVFDVGGPDVLTYRTLLERTAVALGVERKFVSVPIESPALSHLWISGITGAPKELVGPLLESLRHDMVASDRALQDRLQLNGLPVDEALRLSVAPHQREPQAYRPAPEGALRGVRSVQRIPLPVDADAEWAADEYMRWLPRGLWPFMRVDVKREGAARTANFSIVGIKKPLLVLALEPSRSTADRQLFYIRGGMLALTEGRGRLEFREVPDRHALLTAIHDFLPRLPWFLYRWTQAVVHAIVMWLFGRHLARLAESHRPTKQIDE